MNRPPATIGMRHVALFVPDLEACEHFYVDLLGMKVEWRPDPDNVYLTSGQDNLALHRLPVFDVKDMEYVGYDTSYLSWKQNFHTPMFYQ